MTDTSKITETISKGSPIAATGIGGALLVAILTWGQDALKSLDDIKYSQHQAQIEFVQLKTEVQKFTEVADDNKEEIKRLSEAARTSRENLEFLRREVEDLCELLGTSCDLRPSRNP